MEYSVFMMWYETWTERKEEFKNRIRNMILSPLREEVEKI